MADHVGQQLGNYQLIRLLGRGQFAEVYLGEHVHLGTEAAIKILHGLLESRDREGFLTEARTLARLRHPHIVRVLDFGVEKATPFLVLDYAAGGSLRTLHPKGARLPLARVVSYVTQVAEALQYAHDEKLIHRDLKPENLLVGHHHEVLLSDFGIALLAQSTHYQRTQAAAGTIAYMAPEQIEGHPCAASDQYALGVVVYEWLCGERPFSGSVNEVLVQHLSIAPQPLREREPAIASGVEHVVLKALAKDPKARFVRVEDFARALQEASRTDATGRTVPTATSRAPGQARDRSFPPLPVLFTPLIGREQEVAAVCAELARPEVRLLTLLGTGGIGKTRLSLEVARAMQPHFTEGVYFVPLAPIRDPGLVLPTIAQVLSIRESGAQPLSEQVREALRTRHLLLVLDNVEQVAAVAPELEELLSGCPQLKLLITSRSLLHLEAEYVFPVTPLTLPDPTQLGEQEGLADVAAVAFFVERARAVQPSFQLTAANARTVAEICERLDGLPLAIELAAARIRLLPPQALLARLSQRLTVLTGGARSRPERQQTLRNTLKWSYDLLEEEEQQLFRQLSTFVGSWTLEAAEAVAYAGQPQDPASVSVLDGVTSLLDKSLLLQVEQESEEPRLIMLETVREYGLECLASSGEIERTRRAHAAYYLQLSEEAEPELRGPQQAMWFNGLEDEHDNFRAALGWALENGEVEIGLRLVGALWLLWMVRSRFTEGQEWLEKVLVRSRDAALALRAKAFTGAGSLAWAQGNYQQAMRWHQQALALYREVGDKQGIAFALNNLGCVAQYQGDFERARVFLEESLALYRELGDQWGIVLVLCNLGLGEAWQGDYEQARALFEEYLALSRDLQAQADIALALHNLGDVARYQGDHQQAMAYLQECLSMCEELGDKRLTTMTLNILGLLARWQGDFARSAGLHTESLALSRELGEKLCIAQGLEGLAGVYGMQKYPERAARLLGAAEAMRESINAPLPPSDRADYDRTVDTTRAQLDEAAFAVAWAEGRTMTVEQVLAARGQPLMPTAPPIPPATSSTPAAKPPVTYPEGLTAREVEVLRLVAQGLKNEQVAEQLVISPRTVNTHLTSIFGKIGVSSRGAATRYAIEHNLA
jgi:predicted ATPase/DNA-binding CsgD family transcriptional regulator/Tfp pilus assembly protein PilF